MVGGIAGRDLGRVSCSGIHSDQDSWKSGPGAAGRGPASAPGALALRVPGLHSWVGKRGRGPDGRALWAQARVWMAASCPQKGADPHQARRGRGERHGGGAQGAGRLGLARQLWSLGLAPGSWASELPPGGRCHSQGDPRKARRPWGWEGAQMERRLVEGKAQASGIAKLQIWEGAG